MSQRKPQMKKAAESPKVDAPLQENSDANNLPSASTPENSKPASKVKPTEPGARGKFQGVD